MKPDAVFFDNDGDVALEWNEPGAATVSIRISNTGRLIYACTMANGVNRSSGTVQVAPLLHYALAAIAHAEEARAPSTMTDARIDGIADLVIKSMPDGIRGFCREWGWRQFARQLLEVCGVRAEARPATTAFIVMAIWPYEVYDPVRVYLDDEPGATAFAEHCTRYAAAEPDPSDETPWERDHPCGANKYGRNYEFTVIAVPVVADPADTQPEKEGPQ